MFSNKGNIAESVNIYQTDRLFFNMSIYNITNKLMCRHVKGDRGGERKREKVKM